MPPLENPAPGEPPEPAPDAIAAALAGVLAELPEVDVAAAWLFGSAARGALHRESDVDVGVLLRWDRHRDRADRFDAGIRLAGRLQAALRRPVDLVVLNDAPPLLGRAFVTGGRPLLIRDPEAAHRHVRDVQLRAADLAPWLQRLRQRKRESLRGWRHLAHLRGLRPRVSRGALEQDLSLHNDVLFSLLTVCQLVIDVAGELAARRGDRFEDDTDAVRQLGRDPRFPETLVRELERLPGFRNVLIHEYVALDLDRVVDALDRLEPVERFAAIVAEREAGAR
jgi:uncharacterized protein YutE (UPF0331/DUF86 family)/predicted nucleotidyltransferase